VTHSPDSIELDGEDIACLGMRRADRFDFYSDLNRQAFEEYIAQLPKPKKPRGPRKPTLDTIKKQARKAGLEVARYEVKPDGTIIVVTGTLETVESQDPWPLDELRTKETQ
jgi:hypothetical protein